MRNNQLLKEKILESIAAVVPITAIVLLLSISITPLRTGTFLLFLFGALMLILGMGLFTLGADMAMIPMGEGIGVSLSKSRKLIIPLVVCLVLGILITMAEPDLQVLAEQVPAIPNLTLILTVAAGVGIFLVAAELRMIFKIPLSYTLCFFYLIVFVLTFLTPKTFIPVSFDSGGVTTGPMTVPFIMALGIGMASVRSDKNSSNDSFGLIALCSIGPIFSVLILGVFYSPEEAVYTAKTLAELSTTKAVAAEFMRAFPIYMKEVGIALLPIILLFVVFQLLSRRFHKIMLLKIISGLLYTWFLLPIGMLIGYYIVKAEPAVKVLTKQVEEVSNGSISQKSIEHSLSIGVALSVGLSMLRILTGISILWFLIPGYAVSLILTFFVPQIFTGIAFDSGGVASGPMTATFLLPLAMGACEAMGGNILTDAFGIVAMVAMTPLLTIQLLGLSGNIRSRVMKKRMTIRLSSVEDCIVYFDEED